MINKKGVAAISIVVIVMVVAVFALIMFFQGGTGKGVYGGALKYKEYPYFEGRHYGASGDYAEGYYTGVPQRTQEQAPRQIPSGSRYQEPQYIERQRSSPFYGE